MVKMGCCRLGAARAVSEKELGLFLLDVNLSLNALWIELPRGFALPEERAVIRPRRRPARLPLNV